MPNRGLANRRLQPLGHSSVVDYQALNPSLRWAKCRIAAGNRDFRSLPVPSTDLVALAALVGCRERAGVDLDRHDW